MGIPSHQSCHTDCKAFFFLCLVNINWESILGCCVHVHTFIQILYLYFGHESNQELHATSSGYSDAVALRFCLEVEFKFVGFS